MPQRYLDLWHALSASIPEPVRAAAMAFLVALLRVAYDNNEPRGRRRLLEAFLCGTLAYFIASGMEHFGVPASLSTFVGGAVGMLGADKVRELGRKYTAQKTGLEDDTHAR